jgi:hypothetical protein
VKLYFEPAAEQAARLKRRAGNPVPDDAVPAAETPPADARSGALWDYLTKTAGMPPDEAAKVVGGG